MDKQIISIHLQVQIKKNRIYMLTFVFYNIGGHVREQRIKGYEIIFPPATDKQACESATAQVLPSQRGDRTLYTPTPFTRLCKAQVSDTSGM